MRGDGPVRGPSTGAERSVLCEEREEVGVAVEFIDAVFADAVVTAAVEARAVWDAREHGGYVPRRDVWVYEENDAGWPANTRAAHRASDRERPLDWRTILSVEKPSRTWEVDVSDVPALGAVIDHVAAHETLGVRVSPVPPRPEHAEASEWMMTVSAIGVVADVLNRAESTGVRDRVGLAEIYRQLECALLAPELPGDIVIPLMLRRLDITEPLQVAAGITLEALTEQEQLARAVTVTLSDVNAYLIAAATHAIVIHDQVLPNAEGPLPRQIAAHSTPPGVEVADLICQALEIVSDLEFGYAQVCVRPHGWADGWTLDLPPWENIATVAGYPRQFDTRRGWLREQPLVTGDMLTDLPAVFAALSATDARAQLAARRLAQASRRGLVDDILIDACIGIEALLGEQHSELSHRMGMRAAAALAPFGWNPGVTYRALKAVYDYRSKIVHGDDPTKKHVTVDGQNFTPHRIAVQLLRLLLRAHLASTPPWRPGDLDDTIFAALASTTDPPAVDGEADRARSNPDA